MTRIDCDKRLWENMMIRKEISSVYKRRGQWNWLRETTYIANQATIRDIARCMAIR